MKVMNEKYEKLDTIATREYGKTTKMYPVM